MKTFDQLREDLEREIDRDLEGDLDALEIAGVANWILNNYKPPIEWQEDPPNEEAEDSTSRYSWTIRIRTLIAGQFLEYVGHETEESRVRDGQALRDRHRTFIRSSLGRAIVRFLDSEESK